MKRVLVNGCGSIGCRHAANAGRLTRVAVTDAMPERAAKTTKALGLAYHASLDEALAAHAVVVATPHSTHIPLAQAAVAAGADVLIEKLLATSLDGLSALLAEKCLVRFRPPGNHSWETILDDKDLDLGLPCAELMNRFLDDNGANDRELLDGRRGAADLAVALAALRSAATRRVAKPEFIR
jgi:Oxidoreductase family, NAD-binding Rossmann fold